MMIKKSKHSSPVIISMETTDFETLQIILQHVDEMYLNFSSPYKKRVQEFSRKFHNPEIKTFEPKPETK